MRGGVRLGVGSAALLGGLVGGLSGVWLVVLQNASAWVGRMLWSVQAPWLNVPLYFAAGAVGGALAGPLLESARRLLARRSNGLEWAAAWLGSGGFAVLVLSYVVFAGKGLASPSGRWVMVALHALLVVLLACALSRLVRGRVKGLDGAVGAAVRCMLPTLAAGYFANILFIANRPWRGGFEYPAWASLGVAVAAALVGLAIGAVTVQPGARRIGGIVLTGLLVAAGLQQQRPQPVAVAGPAPDGPNVLLVVLDTLRRDAVSAYGSVEAITPHLDAFARQGVLWEDAIVPGNWTIPGHASLFTGALVSRHGADQERYRLRERPAGGEAPPLPTLAESFHRRGWRTVGFVANGQLNSTFGFDRGFAEYYEIWRAKKGDYDALGRLLHGRLRMGVMDRGGDRAVRGLTSWLRSRGAPGPWFAFVNMTEPHSPYDVPEPWMSRFLDEPMERARAVELASVAGEHKFGGASPELAHRLWGLYLGAVAYQDHLVGRILTALDELDLADETVVLITSDHGENFGWRGQLYHGVGLNDDLVRVPMAARGPGVPVGAREPAPVSLVDVFPTLLALTGGPPLPDDPGRPGRVLPPIGPAIDGDRPRVAERLPYYLESPSEFTSKYPQADPRWAGEQSALLAGPWKAVSHGAPGQAELSRLVARPRPPESDGREPVSDPVLLAEMLDRLEALRSAWPRAAEAVADDIEALDEETVEHLKALGYVD